MMIVLIEVPFRFIVARYGWLQQETNTGQTQKVAKPVHYTERMSDAELGSMINSGSSIRKIVCAIHR